MSVLNDRERDVLAKRRLAEVPITLEELSEAYGVSRERIRQIEVRAFEKLQVRMRELAKTKGMVVPA
jgi:RNA polymerase sigma-32 factor